MNRRVLRFGAIIGAAAVSTLAVAPVFAAAPVAQASSNAVTLGIAGTEGFSSGTVKATHDGTTENKTGESNPTVGVLGNQSLLNVGVLAQEATANTEANGDGTSAACGGVAGEGASVVQVGDSSCINPGDPIGINLANLDLTDVVTIDPLSALGPLAALNQPLADILGQITAPLSGALSDALGGNVGLTGGIDAVTAQCVAGPGTASGSATIADGQLSVTLPTLDPLVLLDLPVNPAPNTHLVTDLDVVVNAVLDGVAQELTSVLNGQLDALLGPVVALIPTIKADIVDAIIAPLADALAPLEDAVLDVTLNEQSKTADTINITALHLELLPAAADFIGAPAVDLKLGTVSCGPNGRFATPPTPTDDPENPENPEVPTVVDSGVGGNSSTTTILAATAALMALAGTAGLIGYRRSLVK